MKNMKIEAILKAQDEVIKEFGRNSEEYSEFCKKYGNGAWTLISAYCKSKERGFDEIVFDNEGCIWDHKIPEIFNFCREAKIGWFVFGSGYSGAMETMMKMVEAGAKVGKFVVKEYEANRFGEMQTVKVPGMRINL